MAKNMRFLKRSEDGSSPSPSFKIRGFLNKLNRIARKFGRRGNKKPSTAEEELQPSEPDSMSVNTPSSEIHEDDDGSPKFHPFPRLPTEIRHEIWQLAAEDYGRRIINITVTPRDPIPKGDLFRRYDNKKYRGFRANVSAPIPPLLHTCYESRKLLRTTRYKKSQTIFSYWNDSIDSGPRASRALHVDLSKDIIHLKSKNLHYPHLLDFREVSYTSLWFGRTKDFMITNDNLPAVFWLVFTNNVTHGAGRVQYGIPDDDANVAPFSTWKEVSWSDQYVFGARSVLRGGYCPLMDLYLRIGKYACRGKPRKRDWREKAIGIMTKLSAEDYQRLHERR